MIKIAFIFKRYYIQIYNLNVHQPELRNKFIFTYKFNSSKFEIVNKQIIGKLIKNKLYRKAIKYVGEEYTEDYINIAEDAIFSITFFHLANSYYLMKEVGYIYFVYRKFKYYPDEKSKVCKEVNKIKNFDEFKYTKFMAENTGNNFKEQLATFNQFMTLNFLYQIYNFKLNSRHYKIMLKILETSLTFKFLDQEKKDYIKEIKRKVHKRKKRDNVD